MFYEKNEGGGKYFLGREANGSWSNRRREKGEVYRSPANRVFRRSNPARWSPAGCDTLIYCLNRSTLILRFRQ